MKLSYNHWAVRWAYLPFRVLNGGTFKPDALPERTSLCPLFWMCVGSTMFAAALAVLSPLISVIIGFMLVVDYIGDWYRRLPKKAKKSKEKVPFDIEAYLTEQEAAKARKRLRKQQWQESLLYTTFWAIKNRVCPLIEIELPTYTFEEACGWYGYMSEDPNSYLYNYAPAGWRGRENERQTKKQWQETRY